VGDQVVRPATSSGAGSAPIGPAEAGPAHTDARTGNQARTAAVHRPGPRSRAATALAPGLLAALLARFVAGAFSGLLWGVPGGYAMPITAPERAERALAVATPASRSHPRQGLP
jgi:hypothetical protein